MKLKVFSVYDQVTGAYLQPFFMQNVPLAIRAITDVLADPEHTFNKHSADYHLAELGEYDDVSGVITPLEPITRICYLNELRHNPLETIEKVATDGQTTVS